MNVKIVYCVPCGYLPGAIEMARELLSAYGMALNRDFSVTLEASDGGRYEVSIDGRQAFSKLESGRFPTLEEIRKEIEQRVPKGTK